MTFFFDKENTFSFTKSLEYDYQDFDFAMNVSEAYGDIIPLRGADALKRAIRNIVMSYQYDIPFIPDMTCNINEMLFEMNDMFTKNVIIAEIVRGLSLYEPRISEINVDLIATVNSVQINILFTIVNTQQRDRAIIEVRKLR